MASRYDYGYGYGEGNEVAQVMDLTACSDEEALQLLESHSWNVLAAVDSFFSGSSAIRPSQSPQHFAPAMEEDSIRQPDAVKRQRLIEPSPSPSHVDVNMNPCEALFSYGWLTLISCCAWCIPDMQQLQASRRASVQSVFAEGRRNSGFSLLPEENRSKIDQLSQLFKLPEDLMFTSSFAQAREEGKAKKKWILVFIHNKNEFASHMLNRDVWSDTCVKEIIRASFIFWLQLSDSEEGLKFTRSYLLYEFPSLTVIDPRTGSAIWSHFGSIEKNMLMEKLEDFLSLHPLTELESSVATQEHSVVVIEDIDIHKQTETKTGSNSKQSHQSSLNEIVDLVEWESSEEAKCTVHETADEQTSFVMDKIMLIPLLEEPSEGDSVVKVQVRFPGTAKKIRRFSTDSTVDQLVRFIAQELGPTVKKFDVVVSYPARSLVALLNETIADARLANESVIVRLLDPK